MIHSVATSCHKGRKVGSYLWCSYHGHVPFRLWSKWVSAANISAHGDVVSLVIYVFPMLCRSTAATCRLLTLLAQSLFLYALAGSSFTVWYNYFDYKLDWDTVEIAMFYSTFGLCVAFVTGVVIRYLVPTRLSETQAILMGLMLQASLGIFALYLQQLALRTASLNKEARGRRHLATVVHVSKENVPRNVTYFYFGHFTA